MAAFYRVGLRPDRTPCVVGGVSTSPVPLAMFVRRMREQPALLAALSRSLAAPPRRETTAFVEFDRLMTRHVRDLNPPMVQIFRSVGLLEQIRLLVFHGPRFIGWVGGMRRVGTAAFARRDRQRLGPAVRPIADALIAADSLERGDAPDNIHVVARGNGTIEHATPAARQWLDDRVVRAAIKAWISGVDRRRESTSRTCCSIATRA